MDILARTSRLLMLLCLACGCATVRGQNSSVSVGLANLILQGELNQFRSSVPFHLVAAPAYVYSITGTVHGEGPVFSTLIPASEPVATALETIHPGLSSALQGSVSNPGSQLPSDILSAQLSSGTDGVFNATFGISLDETGIVSFAVTNVAFTFNGQPDTTDRLVFDTGAVTITALFADVSIATLAASNVAVNSATLQSSVICPNNFQGWFVYGTGTSSFSGTSSVVSLASTGAAQSISIPVTGLLAHSLYRFRAVAQDITGPSFGTVQTFRTLDSPPVPGTVSAFAGLKALPINVSAACSDPDGDALKVTSVTDGAAGKAAVIKAGAAVTYQFTSALQAADHFTYTISDGFGGTATGRVNVVNYATLAGAYSAVLLDPASQNAGAGYLRLTIGATGACTGSLTIAGMTYPFSGAFDSAGNFSRTLKTSAANGITITLGMTQVGNGYQVSAGIVMNAVRLVATLPPAAGGVPGSYMLLLPPPPGATYAGAGYAELKIATGGLATVTGALPDGAAFSCSTAVDTTGRAGIFSLLYAPSNRGSLAGALAVGGSGGALMSGTLVWTKPAFANAGINQGPFSITLTGSGARYIPPVRAAALQFGTPNNAGHLVLSGGNLNSPIQHAVSISANNLVTVLSPGTDRLALTIQPATGLFTGHYRDPLNGATRTFHGALRQPSHTAAGYFLGDSVSGAVGIGP